MTNKNASMSSQLVLMDGSNGEANQDHFFDILKSYQLPVDPDVRRMARKEVCGQPPDRTR
jgi:hypothetical protein